MTVTDCIEMGIGAAEIGRWMWLGTVPTRSGVAFDCLGAAIVPGTDWPDPGGFLTREVLKFIQLIFDRPLAGIEVVECLPSYDNAEIASLIATRVICDTLGCLVSAGHLPRMAPYDKSG